MPAKFMQIIGINKVKLLFTPISFEPSDHHRNWLNFFQKNWLGNRPLLFYHSTSFLIPYFLHSGFYFDYPFKLFGPTG
jgi:hypothetical protein